MSTNRSTARRRLVAASEVLRGRPPRFDYGLLIVMPFLAAAGGVLISLALENALEKRRTPRAGDTPSGAALDRAPTGSGR
ncbi:hypothetical protein [Pseudosporangium ferrugineum]|uniref:Uncharacterized protein n=1 Tax=Pseudosporangium ferrugineum TaxID=439699 RepID=A0A2T0SBP4_9ACTN|nr:hypothetical protein [Pseudosporangium ferrugineum]PRY30849.1 hypothetical protein CLV70_104401 [Pseudosporangium ferrugineum]